MNPPSAFRKTRLAPTPSGFLHLGNILSFAITSSLAVKAGARILLRIDDIDRERTDRRYVEDIFDSLRFMNIPWDEGPINFEEFQREYSQLHRMDLYRKAVEDLRATGQLFACECSRTDIARASVAQGNPEGPHDYSAAIYPGTCRSKMIPLDQPAVAWRLRTDPAADLHPSMRDFIVKRKDGFPAYQLTSLVDDRYFGVDGIIRGEDLLPSTQAQLYLSHLLPEPNRTGRSFSNNYFYHHLLLPDPAGGKLSKSAGATSIQFLRKEGEDPAAIYTMIGEMLGSALPIKDFNELADLVFAHTTANNAPP